MTSVAFRETNLNSVGLIMCMGPPKRDSGIIPETILSKEKDLKPSPDTH